MAKLCFSVLFGLLLAIPNQSAAQVAQEAVTETPPSTSSNSTQDDAEGSSPPASSESTTSANSRQTLSDKTSQELKPRLLQGAGDLSAPESGVQEQVDEKPLQAESQKQVDEKPLQAESQELMRPAAFLLGVVPGFGVGHLAAGRRRTGLRLMALQASGFGALLVGGLGVVSTGASRRLIFPSLLLVGFGAAAFAFSWLSDLLGTVTRGRTKGGALQRSIATLSIGLSWVADPQFDYGPFATIGGSLRHKKLEGSLNTQVALSNNNQRFELEGSYYFLGESRRTKMLALTVSAAFHRFASDGFQSLAGAVALRGRLPLSEIGPSLKGFFVEGELGLGLQGFGYDATGGGVSQDTSALLLLKMAYGFYLGDRGELVFEYNHRRDGFAGGLSIDGIAAGSFGHVSAIGRGFFANGPWGLEAYGRFGSAWTFGANLLYRWVPQD